MPRPILIRNPRLPYHVCARANNKEWFYLSIEEVWEVFTFLLDKVSKDFSLEIHAFVLMSNHFHALVSTPNANLDEAMLYLMREVSRKINTRAERINHVFGGPYKWSLIGNKRQYDHTIRYVYQNPIKAGIVTKAEQYPFSTLKYRLTGVSPGYPLADSIFERASVMDLAIWQKLDFINKPYSDEERDCMRRALRRSIFQVSSHRRTGRVPLPELCMGAN